MALEINCLLPVRLKSSVDKYCGVNVGLLESVEEDRQELQHMVPLAAAAPI